MPVRAYQTSQGERWLYVLELPRRADGRRRQRMARGFATKADAETALLEATLAQRKGTLADPGRATLGELLDEWLATVADAVSPNTLRNYRHRCAVLTRRAGRVPLRELTPLRAQQLVRGLAADYAPATVAGIHAALTAALGRAVDWGLLERNPAARVVLPAPSRRREPVAWSPAEATRFLALADREPDAALWRLLLDTGCRVGEAVALRWADLDLDAATVAIRRTATRDADGRRLIGSTTKTPASRRTLGIAPATVAALRAHRAEQRARRLRLRPVWQESDAVFDRGDGQPVSTNAVYKRCAALSRAAGVPPASPHDLRHTVTTLLLLAGVPLPVVQRRLGHATIRLTADVYAHVSRQADHDAAAAIGAILGAKGGPGDHDGEQQA